MLVTTSFLLHAGSWRRREEVGGKGERGNFDMRDGKGRLGF